MIGQAVSDRCQVHWDPALLMRERERERENRIDMLREGERNDAVHPTDS